MVTIKCKNCELYYTSSEEFDSKREVDGWCCSSCENKYKKEIQELKIENLGFKILNEKDELAKLTNLTRNKLTREITMQMYFGEPPRVIRTEPDRELHNWLDILLNSQQECIKSSNISAREQLAKAKEFLGKKLTSEEIQTILGKQLEISEMEQQIFKLQQQAQILQPAYGTPSSSKNN